MTGDLQSVKHVLAQLLASTQFLEALTAVDTEKGVSPATPGPTQVFEGEKFITTDQGYPVVEVIGIRTLYDSTSQQAKVASHEVHLVWTQVGDDELTITAQLERLVRATRDLFWPLEGAVTLPTVNSGPVEVVSEEYSQLMPAQGHPFVKGAVTVLHVSTYAI